MRRGLTAIGLVALVVFAFSNITHAAGSGYNDSDYSYGNPYGLGNTGTYVRSAESSAQIASARGPHGGYTTTTNKCKDCHAVHDAQGAFYLTRADTRHQACDYCHTGGGGSKTNIQMDNPYGADTAVLQVGRGQGTGHTLGSTSYAPADIRPAYRDFQGLVCFDCHSPHGATQRVLTTFTNSGRAAEPTDHVVVVQGSGGIDLTAAYEAAYGEPLGAFYDLDVAPDLSIGTAWGVTPTEGNIVVNYAGDGVGARRLSVWPSGRFMLFKNPHRELLAGVEALDTEVSDDADSGVNKIAIDWEDPLGPAQAPEQDDATGVEYPWNPAGVTGMLSISEFCTDCHDGAAGASTQRANVWRESAGSYETVYSHDAQPRSCQRQLSVSPGGSPGNPGDPDDGSDDNFGPSCRQCHIGAGSCGQCHGVTDSGAALSAYGIVTLESGQTQYMPNAFVRTSASAGISSACVDGGFSFPHRTLGNSMLKDELFGVDYDGTPVAPGEIRDAGAGFDFDTYALSWGRSVTSENTTSSAIGYGRWLESGVQLSGTDPKAAEDMDSVCIDCHGDATYWNGDEPATHFSPGEGWELLLKGLP